MKKTGLLLLLIAGFAFSGHAQEKRALIIGINKYLPPDTYKVKPGAPRSKFRNLNGCVNDGRSMHSIITSKFQFNTTQVDTLFDDAANRAAIIKGMNELLDSSKANDIAFIFYAGHGSRVPNTLSAEDDKIDESIVPSDFWKPGVQDIRDKELAKIFNSFIDKGVKLTVIMDCCHSGSLSRGPNPPGLSRFIGDADYDAKDASKPIPPETRSEGTFLIISSAQDNEPALEDIDENRMPHGVFSIALMKALEQQSANTSVMNLFTSARAILKSNGKKQEPVLGGSAERQQQTLFGIAKGTLPDKSKIAIAGIDRDKVILQGGFALGLYSENELVKFNGTDTLVKLRIDTVESVNRSIASVIKGKIEDIKPGELVEVTNWVSSAAPLLKLYIPSGNMLYSDVAKLAAVSKELKQSSGIKWINELEKQDPYTSLFYDGEKYRMNIDGKDAPVPNTLTKASILSVSKKDSTFYFELPPTSTLASSMKEKLKLSKSIVFVNSADEANYILYGTINDEGKPAYGFRKAQSAARDSLESMPVQTKSFSLENESNEADNFVVDSLYEYAMRLSKIRGWMQMKSPEEETSSFPFHLEMRDAKTKAPITNGQYKIGDVVAFHLVADSGYTVSNKIKRYIYLFMIDKQGNMMLGFPEPKSGNVNNQFPKLDNNRKMLTDVYLFEGDVTLPVGTDSYFVLASDEPIVNYAAVLNQDGVRAAGKDKNPLSNLLNLGNNGGTRNFNKSISNWKLLKLSVKSSY